MWGEEEGGGGGRVLMRKERERERVMKRCFSVCGDEKREKGKLTKEHV